LSIGILNKSVDFCSRQCYIGSAGGGVDGEQNTLEVMEINGSGNPLKRSAQRNICVYHNPGQNWTASKRLFLALGPSGKSSGCGSVGDA
jgi:hypothetical protein